MKTMKKNKMSVAVFFGLLLMMVLASPGFATVTTISQLRMGENNSPLPTYGTDLVQGTGVTAAVGTDMNQVAGVLTWSSDTPDADQLPLAASTYSVSCGGGPALYSGGFSTASDLVGMEVWVKTSNLTQTAWILLDGANGGPNNGFGFYISGGHWYGALSGVYNIDGGAVSSDEWTHLALVFDAAVGSPSFYVNGELAGTSPVGPIAPGGILQLFNEVVATSGAHPFTGNLDEFRMFTFESGAFEVSDLNYAVPEPATMSLLIGGSLLCVMRRKSK